MKTEQEMYDLILGIAKRDDRIRAVYLHGSRANPDALIDSYTDYDIVFYVTEIDSFINNRDWLIDFKNIDFLFESYKNQNDYFMKDINDLSQKYTWCMLYKDGNHIDLVLEIINENIDRSKIINKPIIILLDKDGCLQNESLSNDLNYIKKPHEAEYSACCSGFWWFLNYVAKGIARDQLLYAKEQFNSFNTMTLHRMTEWYIGVQTDFCVFIGRDSRSFKKYLPADIYFLYEKTYSDSNYENFWNAVFSSCKLFSKIASEVGDYFGFVYNKHEESSMMKYLTNVRNGTFNQ